MFFSESFLDRIQENPELSIVQAIKLARDTTAGIGYEDIYTIYLETACLIESIERRFGFEQVALFPESSGNKKSDLSEIEETFNEYLTYYGSITEEQHRARIAHQYDQRLGVVFCYEFSAGDLTRIQLLINELRDQIDGVNNIEQDHRQRLLRRLEKLQTELHKRMSDVDRFWGLVGDAGIVLGKLGRDAKPLIDRVREITDIVWRTQARSEGLPSNAAQPLRIRSEENDDHGDETTALE